MITISTALWKPNQFSRSFSRRYSPEWVLKLHRGFERNLTIPWRMIVCVDEPYEELSTLPNADQMIFPARIPHYGFMLVTLIPHEPVISVGLDTVIVSNIDDIAAWTIQNSNALALPREIYPQTDGREFCNGVVLCGSNVGRGIYRDWNFSAANDMEFLSPRATHAIDEAFPGRIVSYKRDVRRAGLPADASIVMFHGEPKPDNIEDFNWNNWKEPLI